MRRPKVGRVVMGPSGEDARSSAPPPPARPVAAPAQPGDGAGQALATEAGPTRWWLALCAALAMIAGLAAATGRVDHAAAAVVVGAAVVAAPARPRRSLALASMGALGGIAVAALLERPAPLAGVAVAAAAAQLALSPRGRARTVAAGLLVAAVAGALALRAAGPETVGGPVEEVAAGVLILAALAAAFLALPQHGGPPALPTAAVVAAALGVSALGVTDAGIGLAAAALIAAFALALDRRPAAALVAAALGCAATTAVAAGPLALAAAAVAAALAVATGDGIALGARSDGATAGEPSPRPRAWGLDQPPAAQGMPPDEGRPHGDQDDQDDQDETQDGPPDPDGSAAAPTDGLQAPSGVASEEAGLAPLPAWTTAVAALPAGAAALNVAAGRSPAAVLAAASVAVAVGLPALLDQGSTGRSGPWRLSFAALPGAGLAAVMVAVPGRVGWVGDPLAHWPTGVGAAAVGLAVAIIATPRRGARPAPSGARPPASAPAPPRPAAPDSASAPPAAPEPAEPVAAPRSAMTAGTYEPPPRARRRRKGR